MQRPAASRGLGRKNKLALRVTNGCFGWGSRWRQAGRGCSTLPMRAAGRICHARRRLGGVYDHRVLTATTFLLGAFHAGKGGYSICYCRLGRVIRPR